ncbi:MAG: SurA N-terminal domain-containing protein [Lacunisphaera sp.]
MISWIQRYFQKHFRLVFALILVAVALPMVIVYSSAGSSTGRAGEKELSRNFFGINLESREQSRQLAIDASLSAELKAGYNALQGDQAQQYALQRVAGLALADQLHLPSPTPDQISKYVVNLRAFQNEQGQFDQKRYTSFGDSLKSGGQINIADVTRVLRDDTRLDELSKIVGGPGYVMPADIKQQLIRADSSWTVQVVSLDYASFSPAINASEDALNKFYTENSFRYDVPVRPRFSYVEFKGGDYKSAPPTEAEARAFYLAHADAFPVPAEPAKKDAATPAVVDNFPKVRSQVEIMMQNMAAAHFSSKAANDLTVAIYEHKLAANSPELAEFLASRHLAVTPVAAFAPGYPPADKQWLGNYAEQIQRLNKEHFFSDPVMTNQSYAVLLWNETLPEYKPSLAEVHDRVVADFKESEKRRLFIARGRALQAQLQAAAAKSPADFATVAAAEKLEVKSYANFTLRQPPEGMPSQAFGALQRLHAGQVSDMVATAEKGFLVFAQDKKLPDLSPTGPLYVEAKKQLMLFTSGTNENSYLSNLVEQELKKTTEPAPR